MKSWIGFTVCALCGLLLLVCGLMIPIHLRAVDGAVLRAGGKNSEGLAEHGLALVAEKKLGAAQMVLAAAESAKVPESEKLHAAVDDLANKQPELKLSGGNASPALERLFASNPATPKDGHESVTAFVVQLENRDAVMSLLNSSANSAVQELLRCRAVTNTAIFSPSASASGQAFDAAISVAGLLLEENALTPQMRDKLYSLAANANHGGGSAPLENTLLDFMSLGQRFNWGQLTAFVANIEDTETLAQLTEEARKAGQLPVLFSAVEISGRPGAVARYLMDFSQTGSSDLTASLRYGAGGVNELVRRNQRLAQSSDFSRSVTSFVLVRPIYNGFVDLALRAPESAMALKWFFYLGSGFLIAFALHFARPVPQPLERPLEVRGFHVAREILFALGFLVVILLLSEPFLSQDSQRVDLPIRVHLPAMGRIVPATFIQNHPSIMNQLSLLTLLLFFILQGLLYIASLVKLAEIRRQHTSARVKLKLLENEDHLFDAGLYLGFVGTIISLILVSLGVIKPSLMAAYSSTSFGIIFVSIFKIFQLRPARRRLLLEVEANAEQPIATPPDAAQAWAPTS